jgi:hypothetical protein
MKLIKSTKYNYSGSCFFDNRIDLYTPDEPIILQTIVLKCIKNIYIRKNERVVQKIKTDGPFFTTHSVIKEIDEIEVPVYDIEYSNTDEMNKVMKLIVNALEDIIPKEKKFLCIKYKRKELDILQYKYLCGEGLATLKNGDTINVKPYVSYDNDKYCVNWKLVTSLDVDTSH